MAKKAVQARARVERFSHTLGKFQRISETLTSRSPGQSKDEIERANQQAVERMKESDPVCGCLGAGIGFEPLLVVENVCAH